MYRDQCGCLGKKEGVTPCLGHYTRHGSRFFSSPRVCWLTALADSYPFVTFFSVCKGIWEGDGACKSTWEGGGKVDSPDETRVCWILPVLINHSWNKKKQRGTSVGLALLYDGLVSHPGEVAILLPQQKSRWVTRVIFSFRLCQSRGCLLIDMI